MLNENTTALDAFTTHDERVTVQPVRLHLSNAIAMIVETKNTQGEPPRSHMDVLTSTQKAELYQRCLMRSRSRANKNVRDKSNFLRYAAEIYYSMTSQTHSTGGANYVAD